MSGRIGDIQEVSVDKIKPYKNNAKIHGEEQVKKIAESIKEFGFLTPCLIDKDYNLIAGHGRVMAVKKLGMDTVPCLFIEGLTEAQRRAYILADNKLGELAEWDTEILSSELEELQEVIDIDLTGFTIDDIIITDEMGAEISDEELASWESTPPTVKRGEVWELGRHTLMCGDSTDAEDVAKLMGGGKADLLLTDPPYNVALGQHDAIERASQLKRRTDGVILENDNMADEAYEEFLIKAFGNATMHLKKGGAYYCWNGGVTEQAVRNALEHSGLNVHSVLIWVKHTASLTGSDYQWRHEACFYGWLEGGAHYFIDVRSFTTVMDDIDQISKEEAINRLKEMSALTTAIYEDKPNRSKEHPTMKPLNLIKKQIRNSSKENDVVLDLFGGSGTTLLASEEMNRECRMMEYDPHYCDVIIQRWENLTGQKAQRIG